MMMLLPPLIMKTTREYLGAQQPAESFEISERLLLQPMALRVYPAHSFPPTHCHYACIYLRHIGHLKSRQVVRNQGFWYILVCTCMYQYAIVYMVHTCMYQFVPSLYRFITCNIAMNRYIVLFFNHSYIPVLYTQYLLPLSKVTIQYAQKAFG